MTRSWVGRGLAGALVAVALSGCSASVSVGGGLDTEKLERTIGDEFAKSVEGKIDVVCPDDVKLEEGNTFECTATADDGSTRQVKVTQKDDDGNVRFEDVKP